MRPFDSGMLYAELDSLEAAVADLRGEIAKQSEGTSKSTFDLSHQLFRSGMKVFIHCANHVGVIAPSAAEAEEVAHEAPPLSYKKPRHVASRHASVRFLHYLWHRHIDRWLGPGLALCLMVGMVIGLIVLVLVAAHETVTTPGQYP